jgi:GntR family transcriptional regulator
VAKPYAAVPRALVADRAVSDRAVRVYAALTRFADRTKRAWPAQKTLAKELECSVPTIERAVRELRESGWITVGRRWAGGPNEYVINDEPLLDDPDPDPEPEPEDDGPDRDCEGSNDDGNALTSAINFSGHLPSRERPHTKRYLLNETPLAPRGALRTTMGIEGFEDGFDPLEACGLFGTGPVIASAKEPGARQLAYELRDAWARDRPQAMPGDINVAAVAGQISAMRRGGVTTTELRSMIDLFCQVKGYLVDGAPPWKCFLARRHVLLLKVRTVAEAQAAENDPTYWQVKPVDSDEENRRWYAEQFGAVPA